MKKFVIIPLLTLILSSCGASSDVSLDTTSENPSINSETTSERESVTETTSEREKLPTIDYVKVFSPKKYNHAYTWNGNDQFLGKWPGTQMSSYDSNWNYIDIRYNDAFNIIFNNGSGGTGNQTTGDQIIGNGYYFYNKDTDKLVKSEYYIDPNAPITSESISEEPLSYNTDTSSLYKNYYQLLVYSFADSNNDGIGDFKGIANKLDYLKNLGIEAIWLSPINKAASYHSYDVTDYYAVREEYEVNGYTLSNLITDAHNKGINIILDLVLNHTSNQHVWYSAHRDWYTGDNVFGDKMPDLNYDKQEVREAIKDVGRYWLNKGVDGFRLDAAMWIYSYNNNKNYEWWNEWCSAMRETKEDCYIIGEVLNTNHDLAYEYAQAGFTSTFDFNAMEHVYNAANNPNYDYVGNTIVDINKAKQYNSDYILGRALSNHDVGRFSDAHPAHGDAGAYYIDHDEATYKLALGINIFTPGNTFVYYGDELGLKGTCPNGYDDMSYRTPMPFSSGRTSSLAYYRNYHDRTEGYTTSVTLSGRSAEEDASSLTSIYSYVSKALNLKINHPTLKSGQVNRITGLETALNGFKVVGENSTYHVVYNASNSAITHHYSGTLLFLNESNVSINPTSGADISIPAKGLIVYKK